MLLPVDPAPEWNARRPLGPGVNFLSGKWLRRSSPGRETASAAEVAKGGTGALESDIAEE